MAKFADHMDKIVDGVTEGYQKIEDGVISGYKKIEDGVIEGFGKITDACAGAILNEDGTLKTGKIGEAVVGAYKKVENAFVNTFMANEGESVEDAKARVAAAQTAREEEAKAVAQKRAADQKVMIEADLEAARNAGRINK